MTTPPKPSAAKRPETADEWAERLAAGDRVVLARAISAVENNRAGAAAVLQAVHPLAGTAQVVGVTGAPGVGKSTLLNALISEYRKNNKTVAVVAVDPSSPLTGGAILGDRIRMSEHGDDEGVFVRSLAARGHLGGLSRAAARVVDVMDAAGFDVVIVETVGTGQSEVEIMTLAQTTLVVAAPGMGDEIQAVKAGILEIADILVVNKADMPLADRTEAQLRDALALGDRGKNGWKVPVLRTVASAGEGMSELVSMVSEHRASLPAEDRDHAARARMRALLAAEAASILRDRLAGAGGTALDSLCDKVLKGEVGFEEAAAEAAKLAGRD